MKRVFELVLFCVVVLSSTNFLSGQILVLPDAESNPTRQSWNDLQHWFFMLIRDERKFGQELELVTAQRESIHTILHTDQPAVVQEISALWGDATEGEKASLEREYGEKILLLKQRIENEVLLPHQVRILNRYAIRDQLSRNGGNILRAVLSPERGNPLGLSSTQAANLFELDRILNEKEAEISRKINELQKEIDDFRKESLKKGMGQLNEDQKAELKAILGRRDDE